MSEAGAVNHYRDRHRDASNRFTVPADVLSASTGLMICPTCGFPQLGYDTDQHCGGACGPPKLVETDEFAIDTEAERARTGDDTDVHPLRWFSAEHVAEYLAVAPNIELLLDPT
jgi:hypothetical protein